MRPPRKISMTKKTNVEAIQPLGSILLKLSRKKKTRTRRIYATSSATSPNKKITMPISISKIQKTSAVLAIFTLITEKKKEKLE